MNHSKRSTKKFWKSVSLLFIIYLFTIPAILYLLDQHTFLKYARKDVFVFCLQIAGIALGIALIISFWSRRDPELRKW